MIVKIYFPYIDFLVENITSFLEFSHRCNLKDYGTGVDIHSKDLEVTKLLMFKHSLLDIQNVEQAKLEETNLRITYLQTRRKMLFDYLAVSQGNKELESAIKSISEELANLAKSTQIYKQIDIEIDESLHTILVQNNLLN
jgi:hypothetical protein